MASPNTVKAAALQQRLAHATRWPQITEIKIRWRAGYAYIDAAIDGDDDGDLQLCRLKDTVTPRCGASPCSPTATERYEDNILPTGLPFGSPEDALDCVASLYLGDPTD